MLTHHNKIQWIPTKKINNMEYSGYYQGSNNPEHSEIRYFNSLSNKIKNSKFMKNLILEDFSRTYGLRDEQLPIYVGVHFVKIECSNNKYPGISSPDFLHQDGEPFTFAHLFERNTYVKGADNYIASTKFRNINPKDLQQDCIIEQFTLSDFMDSFAVADEQVSHYVSAIETTIENKKAVRKMILIDFSRTRQVI
jgi:hypothetical protein